MIRTIHRESADPDVRFWVFISYFSSHPSQLLKAQPPEPVAAAVRDVLRRAELPNVEVEPGKLGPEDSSGPVAAAIIEVPGPLYAEFVLMDQNGTGRIAYRVRWTTGHYNQCSVTSTRLSVGLVQPPALDSRVA